MIGPVPLELWSPGNGRAVTPVVGSCSELTGLRIPAYGDPYPLAAEPILPGAVLNIRASECVENALGKPTGR